MKKTYCILFLSLILSTQHSTAQIQNLRHYSVSDGLPFILVTAIEQNAAGELWIGGYGGLSRYDGIEFKNYGKSDGLTGYWINDIQKGKGNEIWIATNKGLNKIVRNKVECPFPQKLNLRVTSLAYHPEKTTLYIGTENGLFQLNNNKLELIHKSKSAISAILTSNEGYLFFTSGNELFQLNDKTITKCDLKVFVDFQITDAYLSKSEIIYLTMNKGVIAYHQDKKQNLWNLRWLTISYVLQHCRKRLNRICWYRLRFLPGS